MTETIEQAEAIRKRIAILGPRLKLTRRITREAGKPSMYLPPEIVKEADLKIGQEVAVYLASKKKMVIEAQVTGSLLRTCLVMRDGVFR